MPAPLKQVESSESVDYLCAKTHINQLEIRQLELNQERMELNGSLFDAAEYSSSPLDRPKTWNQSSDGDSENDACANTVSLPGLEIEPFDSKPKCSMSFGNALHTDGSSVVHNLARRSAHLTYYCEKVSEGS